MSFRYRKSINLGGGVRINLSKTGVGLSCGVPGLRYSVHSSGRRTPHCWHPRHWYVLAGRSQDPSRRAGDCDRPHPSCPTSSQAEPCDERFASGMPVEWRTEDFVTIARRQQADEDAAARRSGPLLICDTDALATAIWHERYLGCRSEQVDELAGARQYALYILTSDDIPWVQDGTRDGEHVRAWMTERFRAELSIRTALWIEVTGTPAERLANATTHIDGIHG
jgi:nicotinamide riboside kinase